MKSIRSESYELRVSEAITELEPLLAEHRWEDAADQVALIQKTYPHSNQISGLENQVKIAWRKAKQTLQRQFREAANRDDPERAMDLLKELDKYLTATDASEFTEIAKSVIEKLKANLSLRFRMAVNKRDWTAATKVGEQIIRQFPNAQMAQELRMKIDLLRERSLGQRHRESAEEERLAKEARRQAHKPAGSQA